MRLQPVTEFYYPPHEIWLWRKSNMLVVLYVDSKLHEKLHLQMEVKFMKAHLNRSQK